MVRSRAFLLVAAAAAALVTACGAAPVDRAASGTPDAGDAPLRVGTVANVALAVPLVGLAEDAAAHGYASDVQLVPATSPDEIRTNLTSGRVDVAQLPITVAAALATGGVGVQLLGVVDAQLTKVIGPAGEHGWDALRGAAVHIPFRGDIADLVFTSLAQEQDLVAGRDYTVVYGAALPEVVAALAAGRARYAVLPEQFATVARSEATAAGHPAGELVDLTTAWRAATGSATLPAAAIVVRDEVAAGRPELITALRARFAQATAAVAADPAGASAELSALAAVPPELVPAVLPGLRARFVDAAAARQDVEQLLARLATLEPRIAAAPPSTFFGSGA